MWKAIISYYCIDWIALVLNALVIYRLGKKRKTGFSPGIVANIAWIVFGILARSLATIVACTIFIVPNTKESVRQVEFKFLHLKSSQRRLKASCYVVFLEVFSDIKCFVPS